MSGQAPRFSIIIPAYNAEGHIRPGLESIRRQDFTDYELIVVCDSCEDRTADIAREYTDRVILVDHHLDGLTRNTGIDAARGDFLLFMDDDDWWHRADAFQLIAGALDRTPDLDVLCFGFYWQHHGIVFQDQTRVYAAVWNKAWRRSFVGDTRFPAVPYWSDVDFSKAMMAKRPRLGFIHSALYYYNYLRPGSISWRKEMGEIE